MGTKDTVTKQYMANPEIFADAFNHLLYGGEDVIDPKQLHPLDTTVLDTVYGADEAMVPVQKYRDELMALTAMNDDQAIYLLLGIENQSNVHYAMPVKNMVYDALQYADQVRTAAKTNRKTVPGNCSGSEKPSADEYLSGFRKKDRLIPVITLVVYFGSNQWDGPRSLRDMMCVEDERILQYIADYPLNLIAPAHMTDEEIERFRSNLCEVMLFIKHSKDHEKLDEIVHSHEAFKTLDREAVMVLKETANAKINITENEEVVDMCKALEDMKKIAFENGRRSMAPALEDMKKIAKQEGKAEGKVEGKMEEKKSIVLRLLDCGNIPMEVIADAAQITLDEVIALNTSRLAGSN